MPKLFFKTSLILFSLVILGSISYKPVFASDPVIIDIVPGVSQSNPTNLKVMGSTLYFSATNLTNGVELWKSDGTGTGTVMVKDINPGSGNSLSTPRFTVMGSTLYFTATTSANGEELWKSDGTEAGTVMVKDINPGISNGYPGNLTVWGSTLFFVVDNGTNGSEFWKSDGTEAGTVMVKDIYTGVNSSIPIYFTLIDSTLYFRANDGTNGVELWKSDGTGAGTVMVKDIYPGSGSSSPINFTVMGSTLYFKATNGTNGEELWKSDGTEAGTVMVKDINGSGDSYPEYLTVIGSTLYFRAYIGTNGQELWKSDGTDVGTVLVKDIYPGSEHSYPANLKVMGSTLYFQATNGTNGEELWKSDGTGAGTVMVKDINPGSGSSSPINFTVMGSTLYFQATNGINGGELWKSDGTVAGTVMVKDIRIVPSVGAGSAPANLTVMGSTLYFSAYDGTNGIELWYYLPDTTAPTISLTALSPDPNSDNTPSLTGTATDTGGTVANVQYQIDGTGGSWTACTANTPPFNSASEAFTCTATTLGDGAHTIYVRATDSDGNTTTGGSESTDTFTIDATPPTGGTISIAGGASNTNTTSVTLTLSATEATEMILSEDSGFAGATWEAYATSKSFTLTAGNGTKTVYAKYRDALENTSTAVSDTIVLDTVAPATPGTPTTITPTTNTTQTWNWTASTDATSGVASYAWRVVTDLGASVSNGTTTLTSAVSHLTLGIYDFFVKAIDNATNEGNESQGTVTVETQAAASGEVSLDLAPSGTQSSDDSSDTTVLGKKTLTNTDNVEVSWDKPADTSNIDEYVVHYREIGSSKWETESAGPDADSISWDPGEGKYEWYLEIIYTDGSTSETSIYKFEVDQTDPENRSISISDYQIIGISEESLDQNSNLLLPFGSPLIFNFGNTDWDTVIEIWNWDKTIHYTTMVCGSGICDHGHILTGPLTLVIYTVDEAGNESERREIKITPFGVSAGYAPAMTGAPEVQGTTSVNPARSEELAPGIVRGAVDIDTSINPTAINNPGIVSGAVDFPQPEPTPEPPTRHNLLDKIFTFLKFTDQ